MGFPVGCSELVLPRVLVWFIFLLGALRRAITWCLAAVGLGDLLDTDAFLVPGGPAGTGPGASFPVPHSTYHHRRPLPATLVLRKIPAVPYARHHEDGAAQGRCDPESCAVCLYEFEGGEEVRRLGLCRHVFHRCCIDPWVQIGRHTCPLCRAPIVHEGGGVGEGDDGGAADEPSYSYATYSSDYTYDAYHDLVDAFYPEGAGDDLGEYAGLFPPLVADDDPPSLDFISWPLPTFEQIS